MRNRIAALGSAMLLCATALAGQATTPAGGPPAPGGGSFGERRMQMLFQGITLTAQEQAKVDSIRASFRSQMPAYTPGTPPDSATREKMRGVMDQENTAIRGVLTPEQQQVFDRNLAAMRARMMQRSPGNR
jgi:Spy/CpxP family protein refolding chaperone